MKFKKFILIPILLFIYVFFIVDLLINFNPIVFTVGAVPTGGGQPVGIGDSVTVVATRPYFFKLIRLPIYTNYVGYIGGYHQAFFYFLGILTVVFVGIELKKNVWRK